mgnify:CR=1 FL=1
MKYITGIEHYHETKKTAVTLGKFDGLHRGHQKLVDRIRGYASAECESVLCAFDMGQKSLMTRRERRERLEGQIDCLVDWPFTDSLRRMDAEEFVRDILCGTFHAAHIVIGTDFCFGYEKKGNAELLSRLAPGYGYTLDVIEKEREQLSELRRRADFIIDTTNMKVAGFKLEMEKIFVGMKIESSFAVNVTSFGYKHGIPMEADLVFDMRFIPNPYYVPSLKKLTEIAQKFIVQLRDLINTVVPCYVKEGKYHLNVAFGCTGGQHRSVAMANRMAEIFREEGYRVTLGHRDL